MGTKTSYISIIPKDQLQKLLDESSSYSDVMRKMGFRDDTGNKRTLKARIDSDHLSIAQLAENRTKFRRDLVKRTHQNKGVTRNINDVFCEHSKSSRSLLKRLLVEEKLKEHQCEKCGIKDIWQNESLKLQLDHINGVSDDNRVENLRFLCPNCHSQTGTFGSKNWKFLKPKQVPCKQCGKPKANWFQSPENCNDCARKATRTFEISETDLKQLLQELPMTKIGEKFNVSDNAIRRRCKTLKIEIPKFPRGYWRKKNR